jgi:hypothetical protein
MEVFDHKRGDSFRVDEIGMMVQDDVGALTMIVDGVEVRASLLDLTGWGIASQLRRKDTGELVADLDVIERDRSKGQYSLQAKNTTEWPVTTLSWDVQFTSPDGFVTSSETKYVRIKKDQTRAAE